MITLIENPIIDGFVGNLHKSHNLRYNMVFGLFKTCLDDFLNNQDLYYVNTPEDFKSTLILSYDENKLFLIWLNKFSEKYLFSLNHVFDTYVNINDIENEGKLLVDLLSNKYDKIDEVNKNWNGNKSIDLSTATLDDISNLQLYSAEGTINEISEFVKGNMIVYKQHNPYTDVSKVLLRSFNVDRFVMLESIAGKLENYLEINEIPNWNDVIPQLLVFGNSTYEGFEIKLNDIDGLTTKELKFLYNKSSFLQTTDWIVDNLDYIQTIESGKKLDLLRIFN